MAGHKCAGDELLCESNSNTKKAKRQITRATFEKWQKEHEMEHQMPSWLQCDLDAKGTTWSPSTVLYVGSTKLTYNCSKTSGEIGSRVRQTREQATWLITLLVMYTKLRWLSWKLNAREQGVSQQLRQPRSGVFCHRWTTKREKGWRRSLMFASWWQRKAYCSPNTPHCWNSNFAMEVTWAQRTACQTQRRPSLATSVWASARPS